MNWLRQNWWIAVIIAIIFVPIAFAAISGGDEGDIDATPADFLSHVQAGLVDEVEVDGTTVRYELTNGTGLTYTTEIERGDTVRQFLTDNEVGAASPNFPAIVVDDASTAARILSIILTFLPLILIVTFVVWLVRRLTRRQAPHQVTNFDPVCQATVNPGSSAGSSTFMDTTYHFCSVEHKEKFDADPTSFLLKK